MIFTSGTQALQGRTVNHDEEPHVRSYNGTDERRITAAWAGMKEACFENIFGEIVVTRLDPRPEFAVFDNPILASFRGMGAEDSAEQRARRAHAYLSSVESMGIAIGAQPEQIDHARKVLTRLANWKEGTR